MKQFNVNTADKDELLDQTAILGIEADYSMTVKELRQVIKEFNSTQTIEPIVIEKKVLDKLTEKQRQQLIRTKY